MPRLELARLAVRFLAGAPGARRGRGRLFGAVLAIAVSLVPLIVVQQVADGMIRGIVERFVETGSYHVQVVPRGPVGTEDVARTEAAIASLPGVRTTVVERQGFGLVYSDSGRSGVTLRALPQAFWTDDPGVREYLRMTRGTFDLTDEDGIVLGTEIATRLRVGPGDEIRVLTVRPLGEGRMLPRVSRFVVVGIASTGYRDLDRLWAFIPLERGGRVIPDEVARNLIGVKVDAPFALDNPLFGRGLGSWLRDPDEARMNTTLAQINEVGGAEWSAYSWYGAERSRYISFLTSRNLLAFVMALIVAVAAINISSALVLLVVEKEEDIAILRAGGASRAQIGTVFLLCGGVIGVGGALLGTLMGVLVAINVNEVLSLVERVSTALVGRDIQLFSADFYLEQVPVDITFASLFTAVFLVIALSLAAAVIPSRRAAGISPERILRRHG